MIHLDTNFIIGLVTTPRSLNANVLAWLQQGEELAASAIAWSEFLNGPVTTLQIQDADAMLQGRIIPFGRLEAEMGANLFNQADRKRGIRPDCFIAATAICARVRLATMNGEDFRPFMSAGLRLA